MSNKPNILFFLIDDLGWKDLGCYGSEFYESPNLDALAADSMLFTDAYASCPVCSPTRASIMSGKYPARVGITNYINWKGGYHPIKGKLIDAPYHKELPQSEYSIARALKDNGYNTYHVGKWHLGGPAYWPNEHGFDVNVGGCEWGMPVEGYFSPWNLPSMKDEAPEGTYLTDYLTDRAIDLIKNNNDQPFFLNMWYYSVHTPIQAKPEYIEKYKKKHKEMGFPEEADSEIVGRPPFDRDPNVVIRQRNTQSYPEYAAMIEILDENIGRIITHLKENDLYDNTIIVFTSDNGGLGTGRGPKDANNCGVTSNLPLKRGKAWMYDGGTRVSQFIRWPGHTQAGDTCDTPVTSTDFYPTLLDMIDAELKPEQHQDGVSLCPILDKSGELERESIFWHFPHYHAVSDSPGASIRCGNYKLIEFFDDERIELYNIKEDLGEVHELSQKEPDTCKKLKQKLDEWKHGIEAIMPTKNPDWEPLTFDPDDPTSAFV